MVIPKLATVFFVGATIQIVLFSILSIMLKTRAPGAKTFLQVIKARFGAKTHIVFCVFAFFTNLIVMMSLTIAGTAVLNSLVKVCIEVLGFGSIKNPN